MTKLADGRASAAAQAGTWLGAQLGIWYETSAWAQDNVPSASWAPRRIQQVPDPLGQMGTVFKKSLLVGDRPAQASFPTPKRSELSYTATLQSPGVTYWMTWDVYIPDPWVVDADGLRPITIMQVHDTLDAGEAGRGPWFSMELERDELIIYSRGPTTSARVTAAIDATVMTVSAVEAGALVVGQKLGGTGVTANTTISSFGTSTGGTGTVNVSVSQTVPAGTVISSVNENALWRPIWRRPIARMTGRWLRFAMRVTWDYVDGVGAALKLWLDRRVIFQEVGPRNCSRDALGGFIVDGVYCPVNGDTLSVNRVVYSTGILLGDAAETFATMTGTTELERVFLRGGLG